MAVEGKVERHSVPCRPGESRAQMEYEAVRGGLRLGGSRTLGLFRGIFLGRPLDMVAK